MTSKHQHGGTPIAAVVTLREAGRRLSITAERVRGAADALGIVLSPVGRAMVMTEADFQRLKRRMSSGRDREPEHAVASN